MQFENQFIIIMNGMIGMSQLSFRSFIV